MRALLLALPLAAGTLLVPLGVADAPYTDHAGAWWFTPTDVTPLAPAGIPSVLLRLSDGTGFTAFVEPSPVPTRPPTLAFECYTDLGTGNLVVKGQQTTIAGDCHITQEDVDGQAKYVVTFDAHDAPLSGVGVYNLRPIG